jgi:hypothetical protein
MRPFTSTTRPATSPTVVGKIIKENKKVRRKQDKNLQKSEKKVKKGHLK